VAELRRSGAVTPSLSRRRARLALWIGAAIVAAGGAYGIVTAVRLVLVYRDVTEARAALLDAEAALRREGLGTSDSTLDAAELEALAARSEFRSAERFLGREPLLRLATHVPWLGSQVEAAAGLAGIGYDGSEIALAGVEALRSFNDVPADGDGALGERAVAFLEATRPQIATIQARLESVRGRRDALGGGLLPPLAGFASEVDRRLPRLEEMVTKYRSGDAVAAGLLGYQGARTYLVLGQDNTEIMPGGGLIGVYGLVTLEGGALIESRFADAGDVIAEWQERSGGEYIEPPAPLKRYLLRDWTWNLALSNWSPDFPTAARQALFFFERGGGPSVDGVIAMDFAALEGLLDVLGPVSIDDYGVTVTAANVTEETLIRTRSLVRPGENKHAFAVAVASRVIDGTLSAGREEWAPLLETLDRLATQKHIAVYSAEPSLRQRLRELGWSGEVLKARGDYLQVVEASVHSTKLNLVVDQRAELDVRLDGDGDARNSVTLHYENRLSRWAEGRDPDLTYDLMLSGLYGDYVRLLAPAGSDLEGVTLNGREVGAEAVGAESGKASFGRYLALPNGAWASLGFLYEVPAAVILTGGVYEYRLLVQKQAGASAMPLDVSVDVPDGASVQSVTLDGEPLEGRPLDIQTELDRDREFVIRYRL